MGSTGGIDRAMALLRDHVPGNEIDYGAIRFCLRDYASPRAKVTQLVRSGALVHIKKGLYVFGSQFVRGHYSLETLANLIHGPSYVSLEWALQYYGFMPEQVFEITSVTLSRSKKFDTPLGRFSYAHTAKQAYSVGVTQIEVAPYQSAIIATPEKALTDLLAIRRGKCHSIAEMDRLLIDDLRLDSDQIRELDRTRLVKIHHARTHSATEYLLKWVDHG
jgi:predicted transcriptional regulator of viral defense system